MRLQLVTACLLVLCVAATPLQSFSTVKLINAVTSTVKFAWNIADDISDIPLPYSFKAKENEIIAKLNLLSAKFHLVSVAIHDVGISAITKIVQVMSKVVKTELRMNDLMQYMSIIDNNYRQLAEYAAVHEEIEHDTLEDFARSVVSHDTSSVRSVLDRIYSIVVPLEYSGFGNSLPELLHENAQSLNGESMCDIQQSPQQMLYNFYNNLIVVELKGYAMVQFSYMMLRMYGKGNYTKESELYGERFESRVHSFFKVMEPSIKNSSRELWRCNPEKHELNTTYLEITQVLQGYVQNEVDLNHDGTCKENCAAYSSTKSHSCYQNLYCRQQRRCAGKILNCKFIDSYMNICPGDNKGKRRYQYIEYDNGMIFGQKKKCRSIRVESWWRWIFWHCSYCLCLCDEEGPKSDRYISLRPITTDLTQNKVVTGLRLVKSERVVHLQVQEGQLAEHGVIKPDTVEWLPIDKFKITDAKVHMYYDYMTVNSDNRKVDIDDLEGQSQEVVTGVQFHQTGQHLNFKIRVTRYNYTTGFLEQSLTKSRWIFNNAHDNREEITLEKPDIPIKALSPARILSGKNQFIEFTNTDFEKDVAQTTIPFIDSQPVESKLPVPLSGAGIYYKGQKNFGGFLGLKIITYDYSQHLHEAKIMDSKLTELDILDVETN